MKTRAKKAKAGRAWMLMRLGPRPYLVPCYCGPQKQTCLAMYRLNCGSNPDPRLYKSVKVEIRPIPTRRARR